MDTWLTVVAVIVGVITYLVPVTRGLVFALLAFCFLLLIHPIWNFWWVERSLLRRLFALAVVGLLLGVVGNAAIPGLIAFRGRPISDWWSDDRQALTSMHVVRCVAATQPGMIGAVVDSSTSCSIPPGVAISGATLEYTLDDGGEVYLDGQLVFAVAPSPGTDSGTIVLPPSLFSAGANFRVRVTARNAVAPDGSLGDEVYGIAVVQVSTIASGPVSRISES